MGDSGPVKGVLLAGNLRNQESSHGWYRSRGEGVTFVAGLLLTIDG